jgi:hypothetical protein
LLSALSSTVHHEVVVHTSLACVALFLLENL